MRTQAFGRSAGDSEVSLFDAANDGRTNANPSAPVDPRNCRRDTANLVFMAFSSGRLRRARYGAHDSLVGPAPTQVGGHVPFDLLASRLLHRREQIDRADDLAGLAVAALRHGLVEPGPLHRASQPAAVEPLDRRDALSRCLLDRHLAREGTLAVPEDHARAALAEAAAELGARELKMLAQDP